MGNFAILMAFALVGCGHPNPSKPRPRPPALTPAQTAWVRDICVPAAMAGDDPYSAVASCRWSARQVVK